MNGLHTTTSHLFRMLAIMMLPTIQWSLFHQVGCTHRMSNPIGIGLKFKLKRMRGCHEHQLASYLDEYMYRERYGRTARQCFDTPCRLITNLHMILTYFCTCSQEVATPFFHVFSFKHLYTQITYFILLAFIPILYTTDSTSPHVL